MHTGRTPAGRWRRVEHALSDDIMAGRYGPSRRLPTEPELMQRFGVGRHTVRRAMAELEARRLVRIEQGRGAFVDDRGLIDYELSERTRFSQNLLDQGREPTGRSLREAEIEAPEHVGEALRLPPGEPVYHIVRQGFADDVPLTHTEAYHPVRRFPGIHEARRARRSLSSIYAEYGVHDFLRLKTLITARLPTRQEARALEQPQTAPVIAVRKVDVDMAGVPICYSETVWASERVQFSIDNSAQLFNPRRSAVGREEGS